MRERVCKNCGGRQYEVVGQNMVKCQFCGTLYVDEHASKEEETLTVWAYEKVREFKFEEAVDEFEKILSRYPMSFEAYFGKVLAKNKIILYSRRGTSRKRPRFFGDGVPSIIDDEDYKKAIENAPDEVKKSYEESANRIDRISKAYSQNVGKVSYDVFLTVMDFDKKSPNKKVEKLVELLEERGLSTYFVQGLEVKEKEEDTFNALKTANVLVLYANKKTGYNESEVKNFFDRYTYFISQKEKTSSSFIIVFDNQITEEDLPKDLRVFKNSVDLTGDEIVDDLAIKISNENEKSKREIAKIEKVNVEHISSVKKENVNVESINTTDLGSYKVENIEMSEANKIKWIFVSLKNGDFETAKEITEKELKNDPNNAELLFASLLCDNKIRTAGEFFSSVSNFKEKDRIDLILKYASKDLAEMIVDNWENLVINLDSEEYYNAFLLYLAQFNTPNRDKFIKCAEEKALETLDDSLIDKVLRCFKSDEVDRFVNFYFMLAQKSGDDEYYKKVLDIDAGHEQSNMTLLLRHFKTTDDILNYRDKRQVEDVLKYLSKDTRGQLIFSIVNLILPVSYIDLDKAQGQLDFYLAYVEDDKMLVKILKAIAVYFQQMRFFKAAEKYISIAISKDKTDAELYWILIQIKCHCETESKLIKTNVKLIQMPEWESMLACANEKQTEAYSEIVSKANAYTGAKSDITDEWLDKKTLTEKLEDFVLRNNKILLELVAEDKNAISRGANYYKLQLEPFEKYLEELKQDLSLESYSKLSKKIATRLDLLDLSLDMSINVTKLSGKEESLKTVNIEKFGTKPGKKRKEKPAYDPLQIEKHKKFTKRYLYGFLELFPVLFTMLLLAVIIAVPKQVYLYFGQNFVIGLVCLSAGIGLVNLIIYLIKKKKLHKNWKIANVFLIVLAFLNVGLMCVGFYLMPNVISIQNEKEFRTLIHNAPYAELRLDSDLDMEGIEWKPCLFDGILDGNGHKIENLTIKSEKNISLFTKNSGEIKSLEVYYSTSALDDISNFAGIAVKNTGKIKDCAVYADGAITISTGKDFAFGGIASTSSGTILRCKVGLNILINYTGDDITFGGIVGSVSDGKIPRVEKNDASIYLSLVTTGGADVEVGGLAGLVDRFDADEITLCRNHASVTFSMSGTADEMYVGGLIGNGLSGSENNYATGSIEILTTAKGYVGGLYGEYLNSDTEASISHSYSTVAIECESGLEVDGLVGALSGIVRYSFTNNSRPVCANMLSSFANADRYVENNVTRYGSRFQFDDEIWDLSNINGLPTLL